MRRTVLVPMAIAGILATVLSGCPSGPGNSELYHPSQTPDATPDMPTVSSPEEASLAGKLLVIDGEYPHPGPPDGHPALKPYEELLGQATTKMKATEQEVADQTVAARDLLKKKGVEMSCREVMENVVASVPDEADGMLTYAEVAAAWVTLVSEE